MNPTYAHLVTINKYKIKSIVIAYYSHFRSFSKHFFFSQRHVLRWKAIIHFMSVPCINCSCAWYGPKLRARAPSKLLQKSICRVCKIPIKARRSSHSILHEHFGHRIIKSHEFNSIWIFQSNHRVTRCTIMIRSYHVDWHLCAIRVSNLYKRQKKKSSHFGSSTVYSFWIRSSIERRLTKEKTWNRLIIYRI